MIRRIVGIDPGVTTGICIYDQKEHYAPPSYHNSIIDSRDFTYEHIKTDTNAEYLAFWHYLIRCNNQVDTTFVLERFNFRLDERDRTKIVYTSAEVVGIVKLFAAQNNAKLHLQMAADAKGGFWGTNEGEDIGQDRLHKLGLWKPSMKHSMDALRHVMYYLTFNLQDEYYLHKLKP